VGVWHYRIAGREKYRVWEGIRSGKLRVLIGPRSAVFAPFCQLGLIIIDEEHDPAYKQQSKPYYHARQIALWRAQYNRAVIVLGSATPSLGRNCVLNYFFDNILTDLVQFYLWVVLC
jgi:primosomal protein N' (replication factor Y)